MNEVPHYKGLISDKNTQYLPLCTESTEHTNPVIKSSECRAARTSSQGESYWVSSDWGDVTHHVTVTKVCCAADIRTVPILMSPQYWSSIEFVHKELTCTLFNFLWTTVFRYYPVQASIYTPCIAESSTYIVHWLAVPVTYVIVRIISLNSIT